MVKIDFKPAVQTSASTKVSRSSGGSKETDFISMIQKHASQEKAPAAKADKPEKAPASEPDNRDKVSEAGDQDEVSKEDTPKIKDTEQNLPETEEGISAQAMAQLQISLQFAVPVNLEEALTEKSLESEIAGVQEVEKAAEETLPEARQTGKISLEPAVLAFQEGEVKNAAAAFKAAAGNEDAKTALPAEERLAKEEVPVDFADKEVPVETFSRNRQNEPENQKGSSNSQNSTNIYSGMFRTQNTESLWSRSGLEKAADTVSVRTTPETFGPDIGKALAARIPEKNGTLTIELEPASLGKLTIRVIYEAGKAAVSIIADNPKTLELLNQNAAEIARIMEEKTGQETVIYTPEAQQQMGEKADEQGKERQNQDQEDSRKKEQSDAFAQQLRLGLL